MGYNGAGVYTLPPGSIVSDGTSADAADLNTPLEDLEDSLNLVHISDGRKAAEGNWPMGGFKLTGLASGSAATDSAALVQVQTGVVAHAATVGGTVDAITITFSPANTAWTTKEIIRWTSGGVNTSTAPTISKDAGSTTKTIKKGAGAALIAGDTGASGYVCLAVYDGTDVILLNPASGASAASTSQAGVSELATNAEALGMSDTGRTITPSNLAAFFGKGSDIASASTITIGDGGYFDVTGTTGITDIDLTTDVAGREFELQFDGVVTLTHSSTLALPGGVDITTAAGDVLRFRSEGSDTVRCVSRNSAGGMTLIGTVTSTGSDTASLTSGSWTGYRKILLEVEGISIGAGSKEYRFRITNDGGSTWSTGTTGQIIIATGDAFGGTRQARGFIELYNTQSNLVGGTRGIVYLGSDLNATQIASNPRYLHFDIAGPVNGVRFEVDPAEDFDVMSVNVYGIR